jgi:hypothetical protein
MIPDGFKIRDGKGTKKNRSDKRSVEQFFMPMEQVIY